MPAIVICYFIEKNNTFPVSQLLASLTYISVYFSRAKHILLIKLIGKKLCSRLNFFTFVWTRFYR